MDALFTLNGRATLPLDVLASLTLLSIAPFVVMMTTSFLRIVVGLDVARVAEIMDCSAGSVRVLCHRGLRKLELRLGELEQVVA